MKKPWKILVFHQLRRPYQKFDWQITNQPTEILAVFKNFHQRSPKEQYLPLILCQSEFTSNFIVKLNTQDTKQALSGLHTVWDEIYPEQTFDYYFLNDQYNHQYYNLYLVDP